MGTSTPSLFPQSFRSLSLATIVALTGCGGGGGGSSGAGATTLRGTAAIGSPMLGATVDVKDRAGKSVTTHTSAADGTYAVSVAGMQAPFLLRVDDGMHGALFGAAAAAGTANVHPMSDLVVKIYYATFGLAVPDAFDGLSPTTPMASEMVLCSLEDMVTRATGSYLVAYGVDPASFHPMTSHFRADGTGFDTLLGMSDVTDDVNGPRLHVDDRAGATECEQETQFEIDAETGSVTARTTVDSTGGEHRESVDSIVVPRENEDEAFDSAVSGVETALHRLAAIVNSKGLALKGSDLSDLFDPLYLDSGRSASVEADSMAGGLAGIVVTDPEVTRVFAFRDLPQDEIEVRFAIEVSGFDIHQRLELPDDPVVGMVFRAQGDGSYRLWGNQQMASTQVEPATGAIYDSVTPAFPDPAQKLELRVWSSAPSGAVASVDVVGYFPPDPATDKLVHLVKTPLGEEDSFQFDPPDVPSFPAAGTPYQFTVTPTTGSAATYTREAPSFSTEPATLAAYDGVSFPDFVSDPDYHHLAFLHPGSPLEVRWNTPTTFAVSSIEVRFVADDLVSVREETSGKYDAGERSVTFTFPPVLDGGGPIAYALVEVTITGVNGEVAFLRDNFYP